MIKVFYYIKILRPLNIFLSFISVLMSSYLVHKSYSSSLFYVILTVICFTGASNILNDIFDIKIDQINRPHRILASKKIKLFEALFLVCFLYFIGIFATFYIFPLAQQIALYFVLPLSILYTPFIKRLPLIGNIVVSIIIGLVFIFTESALVGKIEKMWLPFFLASFLSIIRELCKDGEDIIGDSVSYINTFPKVFGLSKTVVLLRILTLTFCIFSIIPFIKSQYGWFYLIFLFFGIIIPLIYSVFIVLNKNSIPIDFSYISKILKLLTIIGIGVIFSTGF
tara:strand:- start:2898 stop:3740 length:843 start_codon:yes stop_codon:yes gene_type:complete